MIGHVTNAWIELQGANEENLEKMIHTGLKYFFNNYGKKCVKEYL